MPGRKHDAQPRRPEQFRGESGLIQRARQFLRDTFPGRVPHIVVGYSGGRDSLALLLVFRELQRLGVCRMTVAHVDHGLRPDSAEAARRAVEVAEGLGVDVVVRTARDSLRMASPGQSVEDIARRFRYQALSRVLDEVGGDAVAVGHHRGDQAETVLLHILRGSGLSGLKGMETDTLLPVPDARSNASIRVIRPFLHESPAALDRIVESSGLPVIEDPTNDHPDFRRNRIRHELVPLLESIAPGATGRLVSLADIVQADDEALEDVVHALVHRTMGEDGALAWEPVRSAPIGLQRRVVRQWVLHGGFDGDLVRERVDAVVEMANRGAGGKQVEIGAGWSVRYSQGRLDIIPPR